MTVAEHIDVAALGRAARALKQDADTDKRAEQFHKAYLNLSACEWDWDGHTLTVQSATERKTSYTVVGGQCHCTGWEKREQCWHADSWRIVNRAMQRRPRFTDAELKAAADDLFA